MNLSCLWNNIGKQQFAKTSANWYPGLRPNITLCDGEEIGSYRSHMVHESYVKSSQMVACFKPNSTLCLDGRLLPGQSKYRRIIRFYKMYLHKWLMIQKVYLNSLNGILYFVNRTKYCH